MMASLDDRLDQAIAAALGGRPPVAPADVATLLEPALPLLTASLPAPAQAQAFARMQAALGAERARRQHGFLRNWRLSASWRESSPLLRGAFLAAAVAAMLLLLLAPNAQLHQPHYPLKRGIEAIHLLFVQNAEARAALYAQLAERRLAEAETVLTAGRPVPAALFDSLAKGWQMATTLAGPDGQALRMVAQAQQKRLQALLPRLGADARPAALAALAAIQRFLTPPAPVPAPTRTPTSSPSSTPTPIPDRLPLGPPVVSTRAVSTATPAPLATMTTETEAENAPQPGAAQPPGITPSPTETPAPLPSLEPTHSPTTTAEPTDAPAPTPTPRPTDAPEPTRTPERTETPEPTHAPEPTRTPERIETPESTHEPEPTRTPERTETPEPTHAPESTRTPERTETPEPTQTPEPTEMPESNE